MPWWFWMTEPVLWAIIVFWTGAVIGSFLNVVIWRLPRRKSGDSLVKLLSVPGSHCPHCERALKWYENIPLISFLALRARCRTCKKPIAWRYFWVETLTACLFLAIYLHFRNLADTVAYCLFAAALVAGFFIDIEHFIIPDEITDFALAVGVARNVWGIAAREEQGNLWGWLPRSIPGAMICAGVFVGIQILGSLMFKKDAMGDGDVKLARAIGSLLPLPQALVSFFLAIVVGTVWGVARLVSYSASQKSHTVQSEATDQDEAAELAATPLGETLWFGLVHIAFIDVFVRLFAVLGVPAARRAVLSDIPAESEEDDFVAGPTHLPFVPSMVVGAIAAVFVGDRLIQWYKVWAGLA